MLLEFASVSGPAASLRPVPHLVSALFFQNNRIFRNVIPPNALLSVNYHRRRPMKKILAVAAFTLMCSSAFAQTGTGNQGGGMNNNPGMTNSGTGMNNGMNSGTTGSNMQKDGMSKGGMKNDSMSKDNMKKDDMKK
jgi:pentapeptide MXKDX repeat protein